MIFPSKALFTRYVKNFVRRAFFVSLMHAKNFLRSKLLTLFKEKKIRLALEFFYVTCKHGLTIHDVHVCNTCKQGLTIHDVHVCNTAKNLRA